MNCWADLGVIKKADLEFRCNDLRQEVKCIGDTVKDLMQDSTFDGEQTFISQHSEMKANIMMAYRHLEDARMRLGKVMQQIQGGISKYDK